MLKDSGRHLWMILPPKWKIISGSEILGKMSTGTWVEVGEVSDKAAKAYGARIHSRLWDQQIVLVLPKFTCDDLAVVWPFFHFDGVKSFIIFSVVS